MSLLVKDATGLRADLTWRMLAGGGLVIAALRLFREPAQPHQSRAEPSSSGSSGSNSAPLSAHTA